MTDAELQSIITKAIQTDRENRSWKNRLAAGFKCVSVGLMWFVNWKFAAGLIIGIALSFTCAEGLPNLLQWTHGNITMSGTPETLAQQALLLPSADRKMPLILSAAQAAAEQDTPESKKQEWIMMTASIRTTKQWNSIAEKLDSLLKSNGYSADYFGKIETAFTAGKD